METLVRVDSKEDQYHDASEHGLAWATLNELIHVIVFVFTLFGMIQFRVKFIRMVTLVNWLSRILITHSFYMSIKYSLLAFLMYSYKRKLEQRKIIDLSASSNCSFAASVQLVISRSVSAQTSNNRKLESIADLPQFVYDYDYLPLLGHLLDQYGGPFKLLGDRMILVYGFWSVAIFIMLAIFPFELKYFVEVGFNFIRFVLSDPGCMSDFYEKRREHLRRLSSWSRNQASSMLTKGAKMILNQRDLRSNYTQDSSQLAAYSIARRVGHYQADNCKGLPYKSRDLDPSMSGRPKGCPTRACRTSSWRLDDRHYRLSKIASVERKLTANVHQLRSRLAINHHDRPSYAVRIANKNLAQFKPFVRSHSWFKASMIIYPIFIFFYFMSLCGVLSSIQYYLNVSLNKVETSCEQYRQLYLANMTNNNNNNKSSSLDWSLLVALESIEWSTWDRLTYYENFYIVGVLSCASSFYCSYFFGTIAELSIWTKEILQQLEICVHVNELNYVLSHPSEFHAPHVRWLSQRVLTSGQWTSRELDSTLDKLVNQFGGFNRLWPETSEQLSELWFRVRAFTSNIFRLRVSEMLKGGRRKPEPTYRFQGRAKLRELMAIKLMDKKETLMRATYLNMCLFFDELDETRVMTTIILRRTIQITSSYAFLASVTHSSFGPNSMHYTYILLATFIIFNLYLACAAHINGGVKKMLVQVHSLISASLKSDGQDADLFEFWLRHVGSFGEDEDLKAYNIYGYAVTWSNLVNIDSIIFGAYFFNDERSLGAATTSSSL